MHALLALLLVLLLAGTHAPAGAQTVARRTVRIAIVDDYPAFAPDLAVRIPRARPVAAIVYRIQPDGEEGPSMILLNPRHATPETIAAALERLATCPRGTVQDGFPVAPGAPVRAGERAVDAARETLRRIERVATSAIADLREHHGRFVDVPDLRVCRPPLGPRGSLRNPGRSGS